jgi:hypothetical protein
MYQPIEERIKEITLAETAQDDQPDFYRVAIREGVPEAEAESIAQLLTDRMVAVRYRNLEL